MKLYGFWRSTATRRARVALAFAVGDEPTFADVCIVMARARNMSDAE